MKQRGNLLRGEARFVDAPPSNTGDSMKLINYIQEHHNGNVSAFAKSQGVLPNQAQRWLKRDCEWHGDAVWCIKYNAIS